MFTGIVQAQAPICWLEKRAKLVRYAVSFPDFLLPGLNIGASVCVHGACQTVVRIEGQQVFFDAIEDTLQKTIIADFKLGQLVNLERSAKYGDEIGGHPLSGHVMGTGRVVKVEAPTPEQRVLTVAVPEVWLKYIFHKGYLAVNGASLTVGDVLKDSFTLNLIPETLRLTTFGQVQVGEVVHIEIDSQTQTIVDTVERVLAARLSELVNKT